VLAGVGVAFAEIVIGLFVLVGRFTRAAALCGFALSVLLFLTASWHTTPYFLGPDIVFAFAWLPFVLGGSAGQPALDRRATPAGMTRRQALGAGYAAVAGTGVLLAGLAGALKGRAPAAPAKPRRAVRIAASTEVPVGTATVYRDPRDGLPDILVRQPSGELTACTAICTHAGCQVGYSDGALRCPCHGSVFDSRTGAVRRGPATQPLARKRVMERDGDIYALPS
jgi:thiosulfate dehydrogenase [quinone] large subunit